MVGRDNSPQGRSGGRYDRRRVPPSSSTSTTSNAAGGGGGGGSKGGDPKPKDDEDAHGELRSPAPRAAAEADAVESPKSTFRPNTPATVTRDGVRYRVTNPLFDG